MHDYDFCGYATKANVRCGDGRTIMPNAFAHCDGLRVPLVWQHSHNNPNNVLGHGELESRDDGMYFYGKFNDSYEAQHTKSMIEHGDITAMSIYANRLQEENGNVYHGDIKEVSLVLAGANPEAYIETVIAHSDYGDEEAIIYSGDEIKMNDYDYEYLNHADTDDEDDEKSSGKTIGDVIDTMNEEQQKAVQALVGLALSGKKEKDDEVEHDDFDDYEGDDEMKHNVFDATTNDFDANALVHDGMNAILRDAKQYGSMKESYLAHAATYGIDQIDWLFPEDKNLTNVPGFIKRTPDDWVNVVMNGIKHTPFTRIKTMFADITADEARARGYIKGKRKKEEVFTLLKRRTGPTTIYKKQRMDRDDIIDITDFDVVSWIKGEMRMMLDEEIARAIIVGDGRSTMSDDHIDANCVRPVIYDDSLFTIQYKVAPAGSETFEHAFIRSSIKAQDQYQGSGNLTMFVNKTVVTDLLLMEDGLGHRLYKNVSDVELALNVNKIVKLPNGILPSGIHAVILDLKDYNVGNDKGGAINMFDDFDIDYNQQKYLIETRLSGALIKPYSAIVLQDADVTIRENSVVKANRTSEKLDAEKRDAAIDELVEGYED